MILGEGTRLGRYEIRSKIGEGGMGEVYLAQDTELDRKVAIKILPEALASDQKRLQRFNQEAKAASALNHPHILTIYEIGATGASRFIATEFIEGSTLRQRITAGMTLHEVLKIAIQSGGALAAAHEAGIIHRDIKPENIMVRRDGYVKLLDFGLAKLTQPEASPIATEAATKAMVNTGEGTVMGTANYMSPEQAKGAKIDARTDLWSLGAVMYEMIARRAPFAGESPAETISLILQKQPAPLTRFANEVPAELERIVNKCLTKDRDERYQTAKDLLIDLRNLKRRLEVDAEIERTGPPESRVAPTTSSEQSTPPTALAAVPSASPVSIKRVSSSAEYIASEIKRHKLAVFSAVLITAVAAIGFGFYVHFRNTTGTIDSIAVLPFVNASGNADNEYLSDGMTETLISSLSQLPNLNVKARSSVFRYKGKETNPQTVGKELNVQAILAGRVSQHGEQLTLTLELVDVQTENVIWSEQYNRKQGDLVTLQSEIARAVSSKLKTKLSGADEAKVTKTYTTDSNAYQLYLKGRFYFNKRTKEDLLRSIGLYEQALSLDSNFALAYVGIADSYSIMSPYGYAAPNDIFPKAREAVQRAIEIDPDSAEAHSAYGKILANYYWNWSEAEREYRRSIELNPNVALTHYQYGAACLTPVGRFDEAISELKRALALDPLSVPAAANFANCLTFARKNDLAVHQGIEALRLDPTHPTARVALGFAYAASGMYEQAISICDSTLRSEPGNQDCLQVVGLAYAKAGRRQESDQVIKKFEELGKTGYAVSYRPAAIYALLGDKDKAFAWLEKALAAHDWDIGRINVDPFVDSLRDDSRFKDLIRRMGFPP
jgi:serine/threonine-protein kinase